LIGKIFKPDYLPYGEIRTNNESSGFNNDYLYTGKELDEEIGLSYYGSRYYDAAISRWTSQDPVVLNIGINDFEEIYERKLEELLSNPQELNSYSYAINNPMFYVDPQGESAKDAVVDFVTDTWNKCVEWQKENEAKQAQEWENRYNEAANSKNPALTFGAKNGQEYREVNEMMMGMVMGSTGAPEKAVKLGKGVYQAGKKIYVESKILTDIAKKRGYNYDGMLKVLERIKPSREGGKSWIDLYKKGGETKAVIHQVTDKAGKIIHRDFDSIRNGAGQMLNKLQKWIKDAYNIK
jgi:RHS repeat-associated protein